MICNPAAIGILLQVLQSDAGPAPVLNARMWGVGVALPLWKNADCATVSQPPAGFGQRCGRCAWGPPTSVASIEGDYVKGPHHNGQQRIFR